MWYKKALSIKRESYTDSYSSYVDKNTFSRVERIQLSPLLVGRWRQQNSYSVYFFRLFVVPKILASLRQQHRNPGLDSRTISPFSFSFSPPPSLSLSSFSFSLTSKLKKLFFSISSFFFLLTLSISMLLQKLMWPPTLSHFLTRTLSLSRSIFLASFRCP